MDTAPFVRFALPDGTTLDAGVHAVVGRSPIASVYLDDPRVSTIHAELSWRDDGFVLLARGGRIVVGGRAVREVRLEPGQEIGLVPGLAIGVLDVLDGTGPAIAPTTGRAALRWRVAEGRTTVHRGEEGDPAVDTTGTLARVLAEVLRAGDNGCQWGSAAEQVWPEDGRLRARTRDKPGSADDWTEADERRLRNRWDQQIHQLRRLLEPLRPGVLEVRGGLVGVHLGPEDHLVVDLER